MYHNLLILIAVFTLYHAFKFRKNWKQFTNHRSSLEQRFYKEFAQ